MFGCFPWCLFRERHASKIWTSRLSDGPKQPQWTSVCVIVWRLRFRDPGCQIPFLFLFWFDRMWTCCNYQQRGRITPRLLSFIAPLWTRSPSLIPSLAQSLPCQLFICQWKLLLIKVKKQTMKRRWEGAEGGAFFPGCMGRGFLPERKGVPAVWDGGGEESRSWVSPPSPQDMEKKTFCFVRFHSNYIGEAGWQDIPALQRRGWGERTTPSKNLTGGLILSSLLSSPLLDMDISNTKAAPQ